MNGDDDRTPPSTPRKVTARRQYDVTDLLILMVGDLRVTMHPYEPSLELQERLGYWLGRAWDLGRGAAERRR